MKKKYKKLLLGLLGFMLLSLGIISCFKYDTKNKQEELMQKLNEIRATDYSLLTKSLIDLTEGIDKNKFNTYQDYLTEKKIAFDAPFNQKLSNVRIHGININDENKEFLNSVESILNEFQVKLNAKLEKLIEKSKSIKFHKTQNSEFLNPIEQKNNDSLKQFIIDEYSNLQENIVEGNLIKENNQKILFAQNIEVLKQNMDYYIETSKNIQIINSLESAIGFWGSLTKIVKAVVSVTVNVVKIAAKYSATAANIVSNAAFKIFSKVSVVVTVLFATADVLCGRIPIIGIQLFDSAIDKKTAFCKISSFDF